MDRDPLDHGAPELDYVPGGDPSEEDITHQDDEHDGAPSSSETSGSNWFLLGLALGRAARTTHNIVI